MFASVSAAALESRPVPRHPSPLPQRGTGLLHASPGRCEERGSGVDKVVAETEKLQFPAPLFEKPDGFTRAILFAHRPLGK